MLVERLRLEPHRHRHNLEFSQGNHPREPHAHRNRSSEPWPRTSTDRRKSRLLLGRTRTPNWLRSLLLVVDTLHESLRRSDCRRCPPGRVIPRNAGSGYEPLKPIYRKERQFKQKPKRRLRKRKFLLLTSLGLLPNPVLWRSEEHTSELQSQSNLVYRLLL